ncbi:hypothetical protein VTK73DRAFT_5748 [Phialemonium thermophilum]|uniref:Uncharacterized protein n=1 Tax=Phialemonium thermophilum TaxID=223376 RepID=A0ABR3V0Q3_9PEZI
MCGQIPGPQRLQRRVLPPLRLRPGAPRRGRAAPAVGAGVAQLVRVERPDLVRVQVPFFLVVSVLTFLVGVAYTAAIVVVHGIALSAMN